MSTAEREVMMEEPLVSVVIPVYNGAQTIGPCIESLRLQTQRRLEVIVVDDGSRDETQEVVARFGDFVRYARNPQNLGIAETYNRGLTLATGEVLMFLACDCALSDSTFITRALRHFADPSVGVVTGRGEMPHFERLDHVGRMFAILNWLDIWEDGDAVVDVNFVENRCDIFRRDVLQQAGALNVKLQRSNEDQDLSIRIQRLGYRLVQDRGLRFTLDFGGTADSLQKQVWKQAAYGRGQAYITLHFGVGEKRGLWSNPNRRARLFHRSSQVVFTMVAAPLLLIAPLWPVVLWVLLALTGARMAYYFRLGRARLTVAERFGCAGLGLLCDGFYGVSFLSWLLLWSLPRTSQQNGTVSDTVASRSRVSE